MNEPLNHLQAEIDAVYDRDADQLRGTREQQAAMIRKLALMDWDGILFPGELRQYERIAELHEATDPRHWLLPNE